jgi:hypothetical protein
MEDQVRVQLIAGNSTHYLDLVQRIASQAPKVEVKIDEFYPQDDSRFAAVLLPDQGELHHREVVVHKWEGKHMVLLGRETVRQAIAAGQPIVRARLISKHALKRCRVEEYLPTPQVPAEPERNRSGNQHISKPYKTEFANTPRIVDKRKPEAKPYQPSSSSYDDHQRRLNTHPVGGFKKDEIAVVAATNSRPQGTGTTQSRPATTERRTGTSRLYGKRPATGNAQK